MASVGLFVATAVFSYRALFLWLTPSAYLFSKIGVPLLQMTLFSLIGGFGGAQPASFYVLGNAMLAGYRPIYPVATTIAAEGVHGTLPYVTASPANRAILFFARGAIHVFDGLQSVGVAFLLAVLVFQLDVSSANWQGLVLAMFVATCGAGAIGLFLGSAAYLVLDAAFLANNALMVLILLTGANIEIAELPDPLRAMSLALPMTRSIAAARSLAGGGSLEENIALLGADLLVATAWAIVGLLVVSLVERESRRRGTLDSV